MTKHLWTRATKTLGRLWAGMIALPDSRKHAALAVRTNDYPRFPAF